MFYKKLIMNFVALGFILFLVADDVTGECPRIFGGRHAVLGEFPMMAQINLMPKYRHVCGGSILSRRIVLTAAHCFPCWDFDLCATVTLILVGDVDRDRNKKSPNSRQYLEINEIIIHESYKHEEFHHDIALLELTWPIVFSENVQPAELAIERPQPGKQCSIAGWGRNEQHSSAISLLATAVYIQPPDVCSNYSSNFKEDHMICAGDLTGRNDSCQGDSGGPLICDGKVAGVIAYGKDCALVNRSCTHMDTVALRNWIDNQMPKFRSWSGAGTITSDFTVFSVKSIILTGIIIK